MRPARVFFTFSAFLAILLLLPNRYARFSSAQTEEAASTPCCGQGDNTAPRQLEFPYYSLRDGFNSTLLLVGASPTPPEFVLAIRSVSGRTVLSPMMTIQSGEKLAWDLREVLTGLGADANGEFAEGSVTVYFNGSVMPIAGQLTLTNPLRGLSLESEMVDNSPGLGLLPPVLNAVWWGLGGGSDARIMISNTSGDVVTADVFLDFQGERHQSTPLTFVPHETKVLSIVELLGHLKVSPAQAPEGGITIISRGPKPSLIAQGKITDPASGFSTSLNFPDPALQKASALHASGVPIGLPSEGSPYAGTGVFIPHVVVRNLTGSPQNAAITVEYPGEDGPQQLALAPVALGAYSTQDISLDIAFGMLPLPLPYCSIRIQYSGAPGTVIGEVSSIEQRGDLVIDSRLANEGNGWAGSGAHPWRLDEETESIMFLTNMGEKPARIGFDVVAEGTHYYLTELKLQPHETQAIDLRKLRDEQKPDFEGTQIPAGATDGSVVWSRLDNVPVMGRLVVLQRHKGVSSNYDCEICDCPADYSALEVEPDPSSIPVGGVVYLTPKAVFVEHCNAYFWKIPIPASWVSWTGGSRIATVDSAGKVTGVAGGTATIRGTYSDYYYTYDSHLGWCVEHYRTRSDSSTCTVFDFTVNISPSTIRPKETGGTITTTVTVQTTYPYVSQSVSLQDVRLVGAAYGGHEANHPTTLPTGTGGTFSPASGNTSGSDGKFTSAYTARTFAGEHQIKATMGGVTKTGPITLRAKVEGLQQLSGNHFSLIGDTANHRVPNNHYGTSTANTRLQSIATQYYNTYGGSLSYNDQSLPWGGLFDIGPIPSHPEYIFWRSPHDWHRFGTDCDVSKTAVPAERRDDVRQMILDAPATIPEEDSAHWHARF